MYCSPALARLVNLTLLLAIAAPLTGCIMVRSSAVVTAPGAAVQGAPIDPAKVRLSGVNAPPDAREIGIVEATTEAAEPLPLLAQEFVSRVASLGANFGLVDSIQTRFEQVTRWKTENYQCGTAKQPRTCSRTVPTTTEIATTRMLGRAFVLSEPTP